MPSPSIPPISRTTASDVKITQTVQGNIEKTEIDVRDRVKPAWYWIKDSAGYGSITATLVFVSFWITSIAYIFSIFEQVGPLVIRPFDTGASTVYFGLILTLYFGRKFTAAKYGGDKHT